MSDRLHVARVAAGAGLKALTRRAFTREAEFDEALARIQHVPGWFDATNAAAFWAAVRELRPTTVVEIGSYLGRSTSFLALAVERFGPPGARVVSIDPHTGDRQQLAGVPLPTLPTLEVFRLMIDTVGVTGRIDVRVATSDEAAVGWAQEIDLLYVDGWHSYDAVRRDISNWTTHLSAAGLVCFDDVGTYDEVRRAVHDGCAEVGLTIYGSVLGQAWAGRRTDPPQSLARGLRYARLRPGRPTT